MKSFKEVRVNIQEAGEGSDTPGGLGSAEIAGNLPAALYQIEKPGVLNQVKGYIKALSQKEYIEPRTAIIELRTKLNVVGLDFDFRVGQVSEGKYEYRLTQYGGRYGWDMEKGDVVSDDGISHRLGHGIIIKCEAVQTETGMWKLDCDVVPTQSEYAVKEVFDPSTYKVDHKKAIKSIQNNIKIARLRLQNNPKPEERTKLNLMIKNSQKAIKKHKDAAAGAKKSPTDSQQKQRDKTQTTS